MTFNEKQWNLVNFIEQDYLATGKLPTFERVSAVGLLNDRKYWTDFFNSEEVRTALLGRGIKLGGTEVLTEEQLTAVNVMLDLRDTRSQKKKLADLGIATQKWEAWLRDPGFQNYLRQRAEAILGDNTHEAALALVDRVRSGDTNAIKFYYEITGRYAPSKGTDINLPALLMRILEIIQKHVSDAEVMGAISEEFLTLASGVGIGINAPRAIEGKVIDL